MSTPIHWDDLRLFLSIARGGRFTVAARALGLDHTTVARRLTALEQAVGATLVDRSPRGVSLTEAGHILLGHAERMEVEAGRAAVELGEREAGVSGVVRLATLEAFGTFLIAPNAARLAERHPDLRLDLVPDSRLVSLVNREADIAIALTRPPRGRIVARRLVDYRIGLYAARDFLDRHGPVTDLAQLAGQPFAWYIDELLGVPELGYLSEIVGEARTMFRSTSVVAQQAAVAGGLGFGLLHVFAADADPRLARVLPQLEARRSYWLAMHADQQRLSRVRAVVEFIDEVVEAGRGRF